MVIPNAFTTLEVTTGGGFPLTLLVVTFLGGIASSSGITGIAVSVCLFV